MFSSVGQLVFSSVNSVCGLLGFRSKQNKFVGVIEFSYCYALCFQVGFGLWFEM